MDDDVAQIDIFIQPPQPSEETDADSGDEDCNDPNRMSRHQLQAPAEVVIQGSVDSDSQNNVSSEHQFGNRSSDLEASAKISPDFCDLGILSHQNLVKAGPSLESSLMGPVKRKRNQAHDNLQNKKVAPSVSKTMKKLHRKWTKGDLNKSNVNESIWVRPPHLTVPTLSDESEPIDFFTLFLNEELLSLLTRKSVTYAAADKNCPNFQMSTNEMYTFIGILLLSGYVPLPRRRMFWEEKDDTYNPMVAKSMRRNKFEEIFRYLHVVENDTIDKSDKLAKVRPFLDKLNELFMLYAPIEKDVSIDESMIPYFGRHGCKQFIKNKPVRFGYKAWVLATKLGYCIHTDIYVGKDGSFNRELGLGGSVVMKLMSKLREQYPETKFSIYCDNFFMCPQLLTELKKINVLGTGTVRVDRTDYCPLTEKGEMKKLPRGSYDSYVDKENNICAIRWNDNSVVTLMSSEYGAAPLRTAKRYSRVQHKKIDIQQPNLVHYYNNNMGGVDQMDANIAVYRIAIRGKKWYMPILLWLLDVALNNAYQLARSYKYKGGDLLHFRRAVVNSLLRKFGEPKTSPGPVRRFVTPRSVPDCVRLHENEHIILTKQPRRRCHICKNKTTKACRKCEVPLHDKCFLDFHK